METKAEKKKKRRRKRLILSAALLLACALAAVAAYLWRRMQAEASAETEIAAGENEELIYAAVTSIVGNEIEVSLLRTEEKGAESGPDRMDAERGGAREERGSSGTQTGESRSYQIPVGTEVCTRLGVVTTFSRLSAGNTIAILLEEGTDNILKIWIVE